MLSSCDPEHRCLPGPLAGWVSHPCLEYLSVYNLIVPGLSWVPYYALGWCGSCGQPKQKALSTGTPPNQASFPRLTGPRGSTSYLSLWFFITQKSCGALSFIGK